MNLYNTIESVLRQQSKYVSTEDTILKNVVFEDAMKMDSELIEMLLNDRDIRSQFFTETKSGCLVFDKMKFGWAISNKEFLPDSYTRYEKKIGLSDDNEHYLTASGDVALIFPHKDCILEGGQTKEDQKRDEVFYNETLAPDQVDKLLAPKVFVGAKRYDKDHIDGVSITDLRDKDNLIIRGNNLLVISSLLKRYAGRVKLIYIDVPYNTGNDSFGYNDRFNHSTWLCFMRNRLQIAYQLLRKEGTIALSVDNYEVGYLLVLLDEIFGKENRKNIITVRRASATGAKVINPGVVNVAEYVLIYSRDTSVWKPNRVFAAKGFDKRYGSYIINIEEPYEQWKFSTVLEEFARESQVKKSGLKKFYGKHYEEALEQFAIKHADSIMQLVTLDDNSVGEEIKEIKKQSLENPTKVYHMAREKANDYYVVNGHAIIFAKDRLIDIDGHKSFSQPLTDIWDDVLPNDLHNEGGVEFKKGKKPEKLIGRIIELCTNEGDLVLDFFAGSGTTGGAAMKMGRQFILVDQMDYTETTTRQRIINTINGDSHGISKTYNWQGGGSVIYCKLAELNEKYITQIEKCNTCEESVAILEEILNTGYVNDNADFREIHKSMDEFKLLSLDDQKALICKLVDKNMLFVNLSDMEDSEFDITDEERNFNRSFYKQK
jgi:adenine-specific DNA-methyltransferase